MTTVTPEEISDVIVRALKTFYQSFVVVFVAGLANLQHVFVNQGLSGLKSAGLALAVAACVAGVSALSNFVINRFK